MSNLIPERRTDKTGKSVIRHVKAPTAATNAAKVPPPASTLRQEAAQIAKKLGRWDKERIAAIRSHLVQMDPRPSTIQLIKNALDGASDHDLDRMKLTVMVGDEEYIRRSMYFNEVHLEYSASTNVGMVVKYIDPPTDDDGNEAEISKLVAMAHGICAVAEKSWMVTGNINRVSEVHYEFNDEVDLFVTHPDRAIELSRYIRMTRGEITLEDMQTYLDVHPSLVDGIL